MAEENGEKNHSLTSATGSAAYPVAFTAFVAGEIKHINQRRKSVAENDKRKPTEMHVECTGPGAPLLDVVGLTMSGGGIRSAAFSLGVSQALDAADVFKHVDYLSTVSGGGYLGASIATTMTAADGRFVFRERGKSDDPTKVDIKDTPAVAHIRDYSNYLIPRGIPDLITALAIVLRGLVANAALVLPVVLTLAALTVFANPSRSSLLEPDIFGVPILFLPARHFGVTLLMLGILFVFFLYWAVQRSLSGKQSELRTRAPARAAGFLWVLGLVVFLEFQPFVLAGMFDLYDTTTETAETGHSLIARAVQWATTLAAPFVAAVTFFRTQIATLLKSVTTSSSVSRKTAALAGKAALWIGGAAVPLLIWVGYLFLCYWAIYNDYRPGLVSAAPTAVHGMLEISGPGLQLKAELDCGKLIGNTGCAHRKDAPPSQSLQAPYGHAPTWLQLLATTNLRQDKPSVTVALPFVIAYFLVAVILSLVSWCLAPNANSLHRLYRDRLSKAFLFDPGKIDQETETAEAPEATSTGGAKRASTGSDSERDKEHTRDLDPLDTQSISALANANCPYPLINAALNIHRSKFANRRGRNADFFLFSPLKVGSVATGYAGTKEMEDRSRSVGHFRADRQTGRGLDLATAMAISGAAFSSNMGANSIKALTWTLALLNIRTGYWLENPKYINSPDLKPEGLFEGANMYLLRELTSGLDEDSAQIYVTDGGHIENLGIYELLRRRCRTIIVIDAEADPAMRFASFVTLQRYARIDLGIRISLPWNAIAAVTAKQMGAELSPGEAIDAEAAVKQTDAVTSAARPIGGPHAAVGKIIYDNGEIGQMLYIKSSLSGDENDYVRDYARRFGDFPHETTGDQFFSEEQFEAYRALGFHIGARIFTGEDLLQVDGVDKMLDIDAPELAELRRAFHLPSKRGVAGETFG